jgi:endonuclease YncB( thermonuclease family)
VGVIRRQLGQWQGSKDEAARELVSEGLAGGRRGEGDAGRLRGIDAKAQAQARHDGAVEANWRV